MAVVNRKDLANVCLYGMKVTQNLTWSGWEPGREYTKEIKLKNVNKKAIKVSYKIPSSHYFTMQYPKTIVLSSGVCMKLPITFRPLELSKYEDAVEFQTKEGKFQVSLMAEIPEVKLKIPSTVNFGMCAVEDSVEILFEIVNPSGLHTAFHFNVVDPFLLLPSSGTLAPRTHCTIRAVFKPMAALVYELEACCNLTDGTESSLWKTFKLEGIGKYPHLSVRDDSGQSSKSIVVDFGSVGVGCTAEKFIEIVNSSPVNSPFQILQASSSASLDTVISCSRYHGVVPAESSIRVKVLFAPENCGMSYVDNLKVLAVGAASSSVVKCVGTAHGPNVVLDTALLNFGTAAIGQEVTRSFKIRNDSPVPAIFQFQISGNSGVFKMSSAMGEVNPHSVQTVIVKFVPTKPVAYRRRIVCLIHNQQPLELEMIGTCHTQEIQPVVLSQKLVEASRNLSDRGLSWFPPEVLSEFLKSGKLAAREDGSLEVQDESLQADLQFDDSNLSAFQSFMLSESPVEEVCNSHVTLDVSSINFGRCVCIGVYQKTVNVTNHTHGNVTCVWINNPQVVYSVVPEEANILPSSTSSFQVIFKPTKPEQFFDAELEGFVFYKSMRDRHLVDERTVTLPWCLTVTATGHTFSKHSETFLPVCSWDSLTMIFPPQSNQMQPVYRTCLLTNKGDNPIHFNFEEDHTGVFSCKPRNGILREKYQIIVFCMAPIEDGLTKRSIRCILNDAEKYAQEFNLTASCEKIEVSLHPKELVYFKPTCVGDASTQSTNIKNVTRIPLRYEWKIAKVDQTSLSVSPSSGTLLPNESQTQTWSFFPVEESKYFFKAKLLVHNENWNAEPEHYYLQFIGEGQMGSITCEEDKVYLGDISVGTTANRRVVLRNESACNLSYSLHVEEKYHDGKLQLERILKFANEQGVILASSTQSVDFTVTPQHRGSYECIVSYNLCPAPGRALVGSMMWKPLFSVALRGVYPSLLVSDIHGSGCISLFSKKMLSSFFQLDRLNELLSAEPAAEELKYSITTRYSTRRRIPETTKARCDFDFGSSAQGGEPCVATLVLENRGGFDVNWAFKYPTDLQLDTEFWADNCDLEHDENEQMKLLDLNLFSIEPKSGTVISGATQRVILKYRHEVVGRHVLPVLFKIVQGREILVHLIGTTIEQGISSLYFNSTKHQFQPIVIGNKMAPVQTHDLCNGGDQTVEFCIDTTCLDALQHENYDWRVFECLSPVGRIPPGRVFQVQWIFTPLEAKEYTVTAAIHVAGSETATMMTFSGQGLPSDNCASACAHARPAYEQAKGRYADDNQLIQPSTESIHFGDVPTFSRRSKLVFLENLSVDHAASFRWLIKGNPTEGTIRIEPSMGLLSPGECRLCKVMLFSTGPPAALELDIILETTDETLMAKYNQDLIAWHQMKEEHKHLFVIRESPKKLPRDEKPRNALAGLRGASRSDPDFRKYGALPPIGIAGKNTSPVIEERIDFRREKPVPPTSSLLHMGVTARMYATDKFMARPTEETNKHFITRNPLKPVLLNQNLKMLKTNYDELNCLETALSAMLKAIVFDGDFWNDLQCMTSEPTPYFAMIKRIASSTDMKETDSSGNVACATETPLEYIEPASGLSGDVFALTEVSVPEPSIAATQRRASHACRADSVTSTEKGFHVDREQLKRTAEVRGLLHDAIENTLLNLMIEACCGEISLTAKPRLIGQPPANGNRPRASDTGG